MLDYGTRLMDQMQRIHHLYPKEISEDETPTLLWDCFYHGLLESKLAATKSVKVAKAAKVKVQGVDVQAKSVSVSVIVEDLGTSRKKKKKREVPLMRILPKEGDLQSKRASQRS